MSANIHKKLLYRAQHRGIKEMDILLGNYAKTLLDKDCDAQTLDDLHKLLELPDQDLLHAITQSDMPPAWQNNPVIAQFITQNIAKK